MLLNYLNRLYPTMILTRVSTLKNFFLFKEIFAIAIKGKKGNTKWKEIWRKLKKIEENRKNFDIS